MKVETRPGARPRTPLAAATSVSFDFGSAKWRHKEEWRTARQTGARHAGRAVLKRFVGAARHADTRPRARPQTPLAAAITRPPSILTHGQPRGSPGMGQLAVATPCGSSVKVWPPCSFSNKEPSKTMVWLPCSGHVQEQKRLPPRLADMGHCSSRGSRERRGFLLRARLCLVTHASCFCTSSGSEANMTMHACSCVCCTRAFIMSVQWSFACTALSSLCASAHVQCAPCMFPLSCPARARMP
jgi:hypothetical protein